jgi:hypothetical protein
MPPFHPTCRLIVYLRLRSAGAALQWFREAKYGPSCTTGSIRCSGAEWVTRGKIGVQTMRLATNLRPAIQCGATDPGKAGMCVNLTAPTRFVLSV